MIQQNLFASASPVSAGSFTLRPYQRECLDSIRDHLASGKRRLIVALFTGGGKTVVFASLLQALEMSRRMLVIAHRGELLEQARDKIARCNPGITCEIEQADRRAGDARVVVASVQTLQGRRLERLDPREFDCVVVDEAHHGICPTYIAVYKHFRLLDDNCTTPLIGFTATPQRGDNVGLSHVFQAIAYEMSIRDGIEQGFLVPLTGHRISTGSDLSGVSVWAGEFVRDELAAAVNNDERNMLIAKAYRDLAPGRKAIAFCVDVAHSHGLAEMLRSHGFRAEAVSGETPAHERRDILARLAVGKLDVVTNCNVLTEGFDEPTISCLLMARPTKSSLLYTQMVGRVTRLSKGKSDGMILDFADLSARHKLASVATLFGLPANLDPRGRDVLSVKRQLEKHERDHPWLNMGRVQSLDDIELAAQRIEFFEQRTPDEIAKFTRYTWMRLADGRYRLSLPNRTHVDIEPSRLDTWVVRRHSDKDVITLGETTDLRRAVAIGDSQVDRDARRVVDSQASWRSQPATDKQLALLRRWGIPVPDEITKGQAASIITLRIEGMK